MCFVKRARVRAHICLCVCVCMHMYKKIQINSFFNNRAGSGFLQLSSNSTFQLVKMARLTYNRSMSGLIWVMPHFKRSNSKIIVSKDFDYYCKRY